MGLEKSPVFRRTLIPWYDTTPACLVLFGIMAAVFLFALTGVAVSFEPGMPDGIAWVPILLLVLSAAVLLSMTVRLVRRRLKRLPE